MLDRVVLLRLLMMASTNLSINHDPHGSSYWASVWFDNVVANPLLAVSSNHEPGSKRQLPAAHSCFSGDLHGDCGCYRSFLGGDNYPRDWFLGNQLRRGRCPRL